MKKDKAANEMKKFPRNLASQSSDGDEAADEEAAKFLMCVRTENVKKTTIVDFNDGPPKVSAYVFAGHLGYRS